MVGLSAVGAGALVGLVIGIGLSVYVGLLDARKRAEGRRTRAQYRGSLVVVPTLLAVMGGLVAAGVTKL